ncbi:hypothetical protein BDN72DRAFT_900469 [Pluteus cervinus]|uniref:Uncharacterized protein n=1 Tax=Pluteus cervinus TaxID=181527 RepID=A0ACD3AJI6_9AGAR|nr:hypothetical protein BDN72DRAFT_900469 [Pluteus cervinus]
MALDQFTQHFAIPIYPNRGYGKYRLKLSPEAPKETGYLICWPLSTGGSNPVLGLWKQNVYNPESNRMEETTYQVEPNELIQLEFEFTRSRSRNADFKEHLIKDYLKVAQARSLGPIQGVDDSESMAISVASNTISASSGTEWSQVQYPRSNRRR